MMKFLSKTYPLDGLSNNIGNDANKFDPNSNDEIQESIDLIGLGASSNAGILRSESVSSNLPNMSSTSSVGDQSLMDPNSLPQATGEVHKSNLTPTKTKEVNLNVCNILKSVIGKDPVSPTSRRNISWSDDTSDVDSYSDNEFKIFSDTAIFFSDQQSQTIDPKNVIPSALSPKGISTYFTSQSAGILLDSALWETNLSSIANSKNDVNLAESATSANNQPCVSSTIIHLPNIFSDQRSQEMLFKLIEKTSLDLKNVISSASPAGYSTFCTSHSAETIFLAENMGLCLFVTNNSSSADSP